MIDQRYKTIVRAVKDFCGSESTKCTKLGPDVVHIILHVFRFLMVAEMGALDQPYSRNHVGLDVNRSVNTISEPVNLEELAR